MAVARQRATVVEFDAGRGTGAVRTAEAVEVGTAGATDGPFPFHCVSIADGSRSIEVGAVVEVQIRPGRAGSWEAIDLVEVDA